MGWGAVIFEADKKIHETSGRRPAAPSNSCNVAEYLGFMAVLDWLEEHKLFGAQIVVFGEQQSSDQADVRSLCRGDTGTADLATDTRAGRESDDRRDWPQ